MTFWQMTLTCKFKLRLFSGNTKFSSKRYALMIWVRENVWGKLILGIFERKSKRIMVRRILLFYAN